MNEKRRRFRRPPPPGKLINFSVRFPSDLLVQVDQRAASEQRSRAAMVEILVMESLRARREKEADDDGRLKHSRRSLGD